MISAPSKAKAANPVQAAALEKAVYECNCSAYSAHAQADKALAVWLYAIGSRSLSDTQSVFRRHPRWRST